PSLSRALARSCNWRLKAGLVVDGVTVIDGAMLVAAVTLIMPVGEAAMVPELSVASATTSVLPGCKPANRAGTRQVLPCGSLRALPTLLRFRKNSTSTIEPSGSVAVAQKSAVDAVDAVVGTPATPDARVSEMVGASPKISVTTTRCELALVPCT